MTPDYVTELKKHRKFQPEQQCHEKRFDESDVASPKNFIQDTSECFQKLINTVTIYVPTE